MRIADGATLHDAVLRARLPIASACGADGICGRCGVEIVEGADALPPAGDHERRVKQRNRVPEAQRLACRVVPRGDVAIRASYW
ncbi:MAG: 2Fe-2S iron-sulfur cluster-binding protein [Myxococcota bacterium]